MPEFPRLETDFRCDVAIVGGGFTGLSAALHLAQNGASVAVLEAVHLGWGASGRNGGFCCLGGGKISDGMLDRRYGRAGRLEWRATEKLAVELVEHLINDLKLEVDCHSNGETILAHRPRDAERLKEDVARTKENYGVDVQIYSADQLSEIGLGRSFHGGMTTPIGFGLNPRKYLAGLARAATRAGAKIFEGSSVERISSGEIDTRRGRVTAGQIIVATNGYSSEDLPKWMAGRYMPSQSNILVTRPLSESELSSQGWTSDQMAFDTRDLLHYFRLMPDRRFLFGKRGGLMSSPDAEARSRKSAIRDFRAMFPAWNDVDVTHSWSGLVCLARNRVPFIGEVPDLPGVFAGFAFHGNGIAMGSLAGKILAELVMGEKPALYPQAVRDPARRFPLGVLRRALMPPIYAFLHARDGWN